MMPAMGNARSRNGTVIEFAIGPQYPAGTEIPENNAKINAKEIDFLLSRAV